MFLVIKIKEWLDFMELELDETNRFPLNTYSKLIIHMYVQESNGKTFLFFVPNFDIWTL
jgi:hypothetical protein